MSEPTAAEVLNFALINRARLDPVGEAARNGIDLNEGLAPGTISGLSRQPLALSAALHSAAAEHSQSMITNDYFNHVDPTTSSTPQLRAAIAGYVGVVGENIMVSGSTDPIQLGSVVDVQHGLLFTDFGIDDRGHRLNMLNDSFQEIGIGVATGTTTAVFGQTFNTVMLTEDYGTPNTFNQFITGIAYNDTDSNAFYSIGEGRGGINIGLSGAPATTGLAGAYSAAIGAGHQTVTFSGGGLASPVSVDALVTAGRNVLINIVGQSTIESSTSVTALSGVTKIIGLGNIGLALTGAGGAETIIGAGGNDSLAGGAGDDTLNGGAGDDTISGGDGTDTAVFSGPRSAYTLTAIANGLLVSGQDGTDTLTGIEFLAFSDVTISTATPPTITSNGGGAAASVSIPENSSVVTIVTASDPDAGATLTYSISGGADASLFQINALNGLLFFISSPNFEHPADSDHNNSYVVQVRASDGSLFDDQLITVNVTNVIELAPSITSNGGGQAAVISVQENRVAVTIVSATDTDTGATVVYSITGGVDAALFQIDPSSGALSFISAPNFERPTDNDHNNSYFVHVRASDGTQFDDQILVINVTDVFERPGWLASVDIGLHPPGWLPAATGDYNGDGTNDVLWFNSNNRNVDVWTIAKGKWAGSADAGNHPPGYQPLVSDDFSGDGVSDLLWYNPTNGDVDIWKLANGKWADSVSPGKHPLGWQPVGSGDFNADGTSDLLWYNPTSGHVDIWKLSNGQWAGSVDVGKHPLGWQPVGTGDFNRDGTSDVLWYNPTTNQVELWKISNGHWAGSVDIGTHPSGWVPAGVGDFNADGTSDLAWFNATNGHLEVWLIQDGHWAGSVDIGAHPLGWSPAGVGDFDGNGVSDIFWREANSNRTDTWLLGTS